MSLHDLMLRRLHSLLLSSSLLCGLLLASGQAQVPTTITPDGTLGTAVTQSGTVYDIMGGTRPGNGPNLFHSFGRFSVGTNDTARFGGPTGIVNILSRVTGGQQSVIDGRLQSTMPGANLYLLNPSGILFGPNASLDISGSFHVSTADVLRFADGATFSARIGERSTLTTAPPVAFGFLGPTPAPITVQDGTLQVPEGKALSVVGGDVQIVGGQLLVPSGRIQIASVASPGDVTFSPSELAPDLQVDAFVRLGRMKISQGALLDTSSNGGGGVLLRSGHLLVDGSNIFANNTGPRDGTGLGVDLRIAADATITNGGLIQARATGSGNAGGIDVRVGRLTLSGGAQLSTSTLGSGRGGTLTVTATEALAISGQNSGLFSNTSSLGDAGSIVVSAPAVTLDNGRIQAVAAAGSGGNADGSGNAGSIDVWVGRLTLSGGAQLSTSTQSSRHGGTLTVTATEALAISGQNSALLSNTSSLGDAGSIVISAPAVTLDDGLIQARATGSGNAGGIDVRVGRLTLSGGAQLSTSTLGSGRGGTLTVAATEALAISGQNSGLFSNTSSLGDAGSIVVSAPAVTLDNGRIQAVAAAGSGGNADGSGNAGSIDVWVGRLTLSGGAQLSTSTQSSRHGGTLTVTATEALAISGQNSALLSNASSLGDAGSIVISAPAVTLDDGLIQARATGSGNAGGIDVRVGRLTLSGGAQLSTSTLGSGRGGTLTVAATEALAISGQNSALFSRATGSGNAGSIDVRVGRLTLSGGAQLSTSTEGSGHGGTLTVTATEALAISGQNSGLFSNTSSLGDAGSIVVSAPAVTLDNGRIQAVAAAGSGGNADGSGNAGSIDVWVGRLTLSGGAQLSTSTQSSRHGGTLTVTATEALAISGQNSALLSNTSSLGDAGSIVISAPAVTLDDGLIQARATGSGNAGGIDVRVGRLTLSGGAQLSTSTLGSGRGGTLTVAATEALAISGQNSALLSNASSLGDAGSIVISAPAVTLDDGLIQARATGSGNAGGIDVRVGRLTLSGGAQLSTSTLGSGRGGTVTVAATEQLDLSNGGTISARSVGQGDAGNIVIQAGKLFRSRNGAVTTEAEMADGGDIQLTVGSLVELRDSQITATVKTGVGKGGNITIDPQFVVMQGSQVRADAFGGPGGNVRIVAGVFLADPASIVSASSALGINGVVNIQAPVTSISGAVAPLQQEFAPISELLRDRCAGRLREGRVSRLVLGGRDGVPSEPGSLLLSPPVQTGFREHGEQADTSARAGQVQERARYVLAGTLEGLEPECARWTGQQGPTVRNKR